MLYGKNIKKLLNLLKRGTDILKLERKERFMLLRQYYDMENRWFQKKHHLINFFHRFNNESMSILHNRTYNIKSLNAGAIKRLREFLKNELQKREIRISRQEREERLILLMKCYETEYKWYQKVSRVDDRRTVIRNGNFTREQWTDILKSQKNRCKYCNKKFTKDCPPSIDHIKPLKPAMSWYGCKNAGIHEAKNIVAACRQCNSRKKNNNLKIS